MKNQKAQKKKCVRVRVRLGLYQCIWYPNTMSISIREVMLPFLVMVFRPGDPDFCLSGPCFFSPCICRPILSFCGIASHAETVSNEVLVSPGRQKSPDFSRWPDRRFWPFLAPQNRCRHGFCQRPGYEPKIFFDVFDLDSRWEGPLSIPTCFGPNRQIFVDFSRFCVRRCLQNQRGQKQQNTQKWP